MDAKYEFRATVYRRGDGKRMFLADATLARATNDDAALSYTGEGEGSSAHVAVKRAYVAAYQEMRVWETRCFNTGR